MFSFTFPPYFKSSCSLSPCRPRSVPRPAEPSRAVPGSAPRRCQRSARPRAPRACSPRSPQPRSACGKRSETAETGVQCPGEAFKFSCCPCCHLGDKWSEGLPRPHARSPRPGSAAFSSPPVLYAHGVPNFSLVFTNTRRAPVVIYSRCCLRHLPGEFDPAMFLTYFCTYLDRMLRPSKVSLY